MHIKVVGQGPNLVMLHGWSMNSAVWHDLASSLSQNFTLYMVDLPGHGQSDWQDQDLNLDILLTNLASQLPEKAHYLGWSLGGLISIAFADRFPERVNKLILMAATPCFVKKSDWSAAMEPKIFKEFSNNLDDNQSDTLKRFLLLQAHGSQYSRDTIKQLSAQIANQNPPHKAALQAGLELLINTDMRTQLAGLQCPVKMILGDRDTLIPKQMLIDAKQLQSRLDTTLLTGAGHAPFIAQAEQCHHEIEQFLND